MATPSTTSSSTAPEPTPGHGSNTNPSIFLDGPKTAHLGHLDLPSITHPTDAIVRIHYVGVCGSDVHFWNHGGIGDKRVSPASPLVMGHEASGTVHALGKSVTHLKVGDKVAIEPGEPCRGCVRCKEGKYNLCPEMAFAACPASDVAGESGLGTHGCLTKYFKIPADFCYRLPEGMGCEEGVLVEPLAVAVHAVRMVNVRPGDSVVVFGSGTIGLLAAAVARAYGARKVVLVDILERKLEFARRFFREKEVLETFVPGKDESEEDCARRLVRENDLGLGADAVIEASGAEASVNTGIHILRKGGHYVQTGLGKPVIQFPILMVSEKEVHCHGAFRYGPGDFEIAVRLIAKGKVPVKELISNLFAFEKAIEAWEATRKGEGVKNIIRGPAD